MGSEAPFVLNHLPVRVDKPTLVVPAQHTEPGILYLHNIDQQVFFHVEMLYFYAANPSRDSAEVARILKDALAQVLVPYHFAAGRYQLNSEQNRLEINCNAAGALFLAAESDFKLSELGDLSAANPQFKNLLVYPANVGSMAEIPLVTLQVTRFKCGGFALGFCISHVIWDGIGTANFFKNLASISRKEGLLNHPKPDRTAMRARSPPNPSLEHPELISLPEVPAKFFFEQNARDCSTEAPYQFRTFCFSWQMIRALKERAMEDKSLQHCSSFEVLAAHIWQSKIRAKNPSPSDPAKLFIVMNIRHKIDPPLPETFAGNAVVAAPCTRILAGDVSRQSLSFCVRKVQETISYVDDQYIRSHLDWCENNNGIIDLPGGTLVTTWAKLGFHLMDFGWGKPLYFGPVINDRPEYIIFVDNCMGDGGMNVFIAAEEHVLDKLEDYIFI